jgi:hypothetical protein
VVQGNRLDVTLHEIPQLIVGFRRVPTCEMKDTHMRKMHYLRAPFKGNS